MDKKKVVAIVVVSALVVVAAAAFLIWPKRYTIGQRMAQTAVFWNDHEAFLFLALNTTGRSRNDLQDRVTGTRYAYLTFLAGGFPGFNKEDVVAYHLVSSGQLDRFSLPQNTTTYGSWGLIDGRLQMTPPPPSMMRSWMGTRWDGVKFVPLAPTPKSTAATTAQDAKDSTLRADDLTDDENPGEDDGFLSKSSRQVFKDAGWHYKLLTGFETTGTEATLPIMLGANTFNLTIQKFPEQKAEGALSRFDFLLFGAKAIQLSGDKLASGPQTLWNQQGWQPISKAEYQSLMAQYGRGRSVTPTRSLLWLAVLLFLVLYRFGRWAQILFNFATMKGRVLKNMATSFSFPPATPGNFPRLDLDALDRYTQTFEGMGFVRLLDFSLVSDSQTQPPSFGRLFAHTRHHCFGELSQVFPKGKSPLALKCSIQSCMQNGWTITFSDRKPQAASSLLRRRKAIGICMPESNPSELLQAFLKMRDQVCLDLGIQTINDDTLEAYTAKMQRSAAEMREAVQQKSFVTGVPEVYLRKFSLLKTKPEYVWLGDYPKEAEQRKQGFSTFAATAR